VPALAKFVPKYSTGVEGWPRWLHEKVKNRAAAAELVVAMARKQEYLTWCARKDLHFQAAAKHGVKGAQLRIRAQQLYDMNDER